MAITAPAFSHIIQNLTDFAYPETNFAAITGPEDGFTEMGKYWNLHKFNLFLNGDFFPDISNWQFSGDITIPANPGDRWFWNAADFSFTDVNVGYDVFVDGFIEFAQTGQGHYKLLPYIKISNSLNSVYYLFTREPSILPPAGTGPVLIMSVTVPSYYSGPVGHDFMAFTFNDTIPDAYYVPSSYV